MRGLAVIFFGGLLSGLLSTAAMSADPPAEEKEAVAGLRRFSTNIQFHREDGRVWLVRLSKAAVKDEHLAHLQPFSRIEYLAIVCPQVTDTGLAHIAGLTSLETLMLSQSGLTDAGMKSLAGLTSLQRLFLDDTQIGDAGVAHLSGLKKLHTLSLRNTKVTSTGLKHLAGLTELETLILAGTAIDDAALEVLAGFPKLKLLSLADCPINGDGLQQLAALEKLEHLELSGTEVSAESLQSMPALAGLKVLELRDLTISPTQRDALRTHYPKASLFFDPMPSATVAAAAEDSGDPQPAEAESQPAATPEANELAILPPLHERWSQSEEVPDFQRHVTPLLGRLGCNGRACHGSFQGQGGFRLSMFGYDFDLDHTNLAERINKDKPAESLVLNKPTSEDDHGGGLRLEAGSWEQDLLRRWIAGGAENVGPDAPRFERLEITPAEIVFSKAGDSVPLRAVAVWSDGTREDVTALTRFQSNDDSVAAVSPTGVVTSRGTGDTQIISFYDNGIIATPALLPLTDRVGDRYPDVPTPTRIDELVVAKLSKLGIVPSDRCTDEEFLRRASLDLIGTLPTPEEIAAFIADTAPDKRERKIDELLEHPAYVTWWTTRLCDLTGSNAGYLGGTEMAQPVAQQWRDWIERRVQENVGWHRIAEGIILARSRRPGERYSDFIARRSRYTDRAEPDDFAALENPLPHFWFRSNIGQPTDKALAFGYTFLGVRLDCAQCHKHPYDQWSQQDFEQFTGFFSRIKSGTPADAKAWHGTAMGMLGVPKILNTAATRRQSYLRIAAEGRPIPWLEIYVEPPGEKPQPAKLLGGTPLDLNDYDDPRVPLMEWVLTEPNRYFAKAFVNRIWANYFHRGIIDPPDDLNLANPPVNAALLNWLVEEFIAHDYDMKWLHRTILLSRTYQLSWRPNDTNRTDEKNFSRAVIRRIPAEVAIDAVLQATVGSAKLPTFGTQMQTRKIGQHPQSYQARAIDFSLLIFGKPLRTTNCDCERKSEPTLLQALYLRNDKELFTQLDRADGWIAELKKAGENAPPVEEIVRSAYLRTLSRIPTAEEIREGITYLEDSTSPAEGTRDLVWALLNTQEFITNH